jgi:ubiquinol-cytochrome c reductase cytochrome c1 subunit
MAMKKLIALTIALFAVCVATPVVASSGGGHDLIQQSDANINDRESLQRGSKYFMNYCLSCHSLKYMRYSRMAEDLGLTEAEVMDSLNFTGTKFGETMTVAMQPVDGAKWLGVAAPDLSLVARVKHGGPDWIYSYLKSFYVDPKKPMGWNNTVFPNASMPHVLWELQGTQAAVYETHKGHGAGGKETQTQVFSHFEPITPGKLNAKEYDQVARDIAAFLEYAGDPSAAKRESVGWIVVLFLAFLTFCAWLLKTEYWSDVH